MDTLSKARRSWNMSRIRSANTGPEKRVHSLLRRFGYRMRLHARDLPGSPDIALVRHRCAIFVHGCFWHRHSGCRFAYTPKSKVRFWQNKFSQNVDRDLKCARELKRLGWHVRVIWECETENPVALRNRLKAIVRSLTSDTGRAARKRLNK